MPVVTTPAVSAGGPVRRTIHIIRAPVARGSQQRGATISVVVIAEALLGRAEMWGLQECLGCLSRLGVWRASEAARAKKLDSTGKDLESGRDDWEFESWDKSAVASNPPPIIQTLDDFDGSAPQPPPPNSEPEVDYFSGMGLETQYVPPVQVEGATHPAALFQSQPPGPAGSLLCRRRSADGLVRSQEEDQRLAADGHGRRRHRPRLLVRRSPAGGRACSRPSLPPAQRPGSCEPAAPEDNRRLPCCARRETGKKKKKRGLGAKAV
jgi:hypothetical protein